MPSKPKARGTIREAGSGGTVRKQRELQEQQQRKESARAPSVKPSHAVQARSRPRPETMPAQHLQKPGLEAEMAIKPQFQAAGYRGSGKLEGMVALITGGDSGIGRAVAVLYAREGADVAIVYLSSHEDARETQHWVEKEGRRCLLIAGDVKDPGFCRQAVEKTVHEFDHLDILSSWLLPCVPATSRASCCRSPARSAARQRRACAERARMETEFVSYSTRQSRPVEAGGDVPSNGDSSGRKGITQ